MVTFRTPPHDKVRDDLKNTSLILNRSGSLMKDLAFISAVYFK